jgi:conjugal transfer pilus assembly protein TraW
MTPATTKREWLFDPSIVTEDDIVDAKGNLIAARGTGSIRSTWCN